MSHVDEGTLHAFLDGELRAHDPAAADRVEAHIQECAECRERLEQASALHDRAAGVLEDLDSGAGAAPDFEEVRVRAGEPTTSAPSPETSAASSERDARRRARYRWTRRGAWAAAIVVALGAGYIARDLLVGGGTVEPAASEFMAPPRGGADAPTDASVDEKSATEDEGASTGAGSVEGASVDRAESPPVPDAAGSELMADRAEPERRRATESAGQQAAEPLEPTAEEVEAAAYAAASAEAGVERWVESTVEDAETRVGRLYVLPGAEITSVEVAEGETEAARTRQQVAVETEVVVIQRAGDGLAQEEADAVSELRMPAPTPMSGDQPMAPTGALRQGAPGPAPDTARSFQSVSVPVDGAILTVTGTMPVQALRVLAGSATPRTR